MRCKEGDLALVVKEERGCEQNIGRIVRVHGPIWCGGEHGPTWVISSADGLPWLPWLYRRRDGSVGITTTRDRAIDHPDAWLLPLRDDEAPGGDKSEKAAPASCEPLDIAARIFTRTRRMSPQRGMRGQMQPLRTCRGAASASKASAPLVEGRVAGAVGPAQLLDRDAGLALSQGADDLLVGKSALPQGLVLSTQWVARLRSLLSITCAHRRRTSRRAVCRLAAQDVV